AQYPVGYLVVLAALFTVSDFFSIPGGDAVVVGVYHSLIGALSVWLVYLIGRAVFSRRVGMIAAGALAVFPSSVYLAATYSIEPTFIVLSLALAALVVTHDWSTRPGRGR
ncbi:MAG TPA: glycosyltransferase family 39 protein, partial [Ilumatobacteraceae bacterium]|nr:glycosyltransferase family 39 protein [Ilumatobacteraceae bacterium]